MHVEDIDDFPFYRPEPPQIFRRLPELKPSTLYVFGESSDLSSPHARHAKMQITGTGIGGNGGVCVEQIVLPCGHLVPMERVGETATASAEFIDSALSFQESKNSELQRAWGNVPHEDRISIDKQWESHIGNLPKKPKL